LASCDLGSVFKILGDEATTAEVSWRQPDEQSAASWLRRRIDQEELHGFSMWAIERLVDGEVVGLCGFFPSERDEIELGYVVYAPLWRQGYATEAAQAAVAAALSAGHHVYATIRPSNEGSLAVAAGAGLRQDGEITDERGLLFVYRSHPRDRATKD
jgi:[ribosomal protein S5]-alanine N-acetyltransferase